MDTFSQKFSLEGKVALVTGAAYGIGFAIAEAYAKAGAKIAFNCRSQKHMDQALADYKAKGIDAKGYICDVTKEEEVKAMVADIERELGTIDILVNNAGIIKRIPMTEMSVEDFRQVVDIDLNAHVNNSVFLIWALDSVPDEFQRDRLPERLKISFLKEVLPQNIISSQCQLSGDRSIHSLVNKSDGSECARINIDWKQLA